MLGKRTMVTVAVAALIAISVTGCSYSTDGGYMERTGTVDDATELDMPKMPSNENLDSMLSSKDGVKIAKVSGMWMWRNTRNSSKDSREVYDSITVNLKVSGAIIQKRFDCDNKAVLIMNDVDEDGAFMTYGDGDTYAYVVHIPAE